MNFALTQNIGEKMKERKIKMAKFKDLSGKYKACGEASKTCSMGGLCTSCMYAYPGNGIIDGKTESYVDVCTMSKKQAARKEFDSAIEKCMNFEREHNIDNRATILTTVAKIKI